MPQKTHARRKLNREQSRDLDVKIRFMEGIVRRDPDYFEALQLLGDHYTQRGKFVEGLVVDQKLSQLLPEDPVVFYNLGCSYSLTGQMEPAFAALEKAVALGYDDFKWMSRDPDLRKFRKHPLYRKLKLKIRKLKVATR